MATRALSLGLTALTLASSIAVTGCKKKSDSVQDAGVVPNRVRSETLGFAFDLGPEWVASEAERGTRPDWALDVRRRPPKDRKFLVAPRFVVTATITTLPDTDGVVAETANTLRTFTRRAGVELERMTSTTRQVDGVPVGDIELAYKAQTKPGDTVKQVVHRSFVTRRTQKDGSAVALIMTVTYMAEDQDVALPDVLRMFSSLRFSGPGPTHEREAR